MDNNNKAKVDILINSSIGALGSDEDIIIIDSEKEYRDMLEPSEMECFTSDIICSLADRTVDCFREMILGLDKETARIIYSVLNEHDSMKAAGMLRMMFGIAGMEQEAYNVDLINICAFYDDTAYDFFMECIRDTDILGWFMVEGNNDVELMMKG